MRKGRLFAKIIYYVFTFAIGVVLALGLPYHFVNYTIPGEYVSERLQCDDYDSAMTLVSDAFEREPVYKSDLPDGGKIVLFNALLSEQKVFEDVDGSRARYSELYFGILGFVYGTTQLNVYSEKDNLAALEAERADGKTTSVPLTDFDANGDGVNDGNSVYQNNGYIIAEIDSRKADSVRKLTLKNADGSVFWTSEPINLTFDGEFFDVFAQLPLYNQLSFNYVQRNADTETIAQQLSDLMQSFVDSVAENDGFHINREDDPEYSAVYRQVVKRANARAIPLIIVYFVVIYVIGDFLLGNFYIVKFFKWFLFKVCKIPRKKKEPKKEEVFGHDYYSMVTMSLDISDAQDLSGSVEIKYTNSDAEVKFTLLKAENYTATQRIKAGVYVNPFIDINRSFAAADLPDNLEIEGYRVQKTVKIVRVNSASGSSPQEDISNAEEQDSAHLREPQTESDEQTKQEK